MAEAAVGLALAPDEASTRADAQMDLAEARRFGGQPAEAMAAAEEALRLYGAKGHLVGARRARAFLAEWRRVPIPGKEGGPGDSRRSERQRSFP
jgi:hypothetical protein